jgi:serine/threonine protein kinase/tetratricopeptide (TPR) repeat protein
MTIECPTCQHENPEETAFCGKCGTKFDSDVGPTKTLETPNEELKRGSVFAGRYEIIEELGKGGMSRVYRVEDKKIKQEIALKLIKPEIASDKKTVERFKNELTTAREIAHRNVCRMFDLGEEKGQHYITMEYVPGGDLKRLIRRTKHLAVGTAISIAKQICKGLEEAHSLGIVHRDLKPNNIMIDDNGNVRIMDFGIARTVKEKGITGPGVMIDTPEYMSPEQVEAKEVDQRSDIYSLGVIMYEMLTGRLPFEADTPFAVGVKHKSEIPVNPKDLNSQIPDDLSGVILKCLEKDKEDRYQSAGEARSKLEKIEHGLPITDRVIPKKKTLTSKEITVTVGLKRAILPAIVLAAVLIASLLLIWSPWSAKTSAPIPSDKPSIAVLPFEDSSPDKDQEPFCDGLSEALIKTLSKLSNLEVRGKTSSFFFKGKEQNIQMIGEKLAVQFILQGSLQKAGNTLRIIASLIDVSDDSVVWSEDYDGDLEDTFAFQDEIALAVADELRVGLQAGEREALSEHPTENIEALQFYQMGRFFRYKTPHSAEWMFQARDYYEQAIEKDPNFSAAYAQLSESLMMLQGLGWLPWNEWAENERTVRKYVQQALDLDPFSSEAHSTRGVVIEVFDLDWEGAEKEFKGAIDLNANDFGAHWEYALLLERTNRFKKAEEECLKALEIETLSQAAMGTLANIYDYMGLEDSAVEIREKRNRTWPPSIEDRNPIQAADENMAKYGRNPRFIYLQGNYYAQTGNVAEAEKKIGELKTLYESHRVDTSAYRIAQISNTLGRKEEALDWLEKACENEDTRQLEILLDNWMESVRSDPRFRAILVKLKLDKYLD